MKKLFLLLAALLPSLLARSQEADDRGPYAEVTLVARAEYSTQDFGHHLGNSCFYVLVDGGFTPRLSFSVSTHLLSAQPGDLYKYTFYSDVTNWLDWAYLSYDFGKVSFSLGKDCVAPGTFEIDEYDFNQFYETVSPYWTVVNPYQWGGKLTWSPIDDFSLIAHVTTSPFGQRPFSSGLYAYTLSAMGNAGCYQGLFSFNFFQKEGGFMKLLNLGTRFNLNKWQITWDAYVDCSKNVPMSHQLYATFSPIEKLSITGKAGVHTVGLEEDNWLEWAKATWLGALSVDWMPWRMVKFHALVCYDTFLNKPSFNIGVTWKITL